MIKILSLLLIFFTSIVSFASDSTHGSHGVPWSALYPQFLNFAVVLGILIYFSKTKLGEVFKIRQSQYTDLVTRAEKAKVEAEASKQKISERLSKLVKSANDDIEKARSEALQLKNQIIKDAETLSVRMAEEAKRASFF